MGSPAAAGMLAHLGKLLKNATNKWVNMHPHKFLLSMVACMVCAQSCALLHGLPGPPGELLLT